MAQITGRLCVRLPWWWKVYIAAAEFCDACGIEIDPNVCAAFILKHAKIEIR